MNEFPCPNCGTTLNVAVTAISVGVGEPGPHEEPKPPRPTIGVGTRLRLHAAAYEGKTYMLCRPNNIVDTTGRQEVCLVNAKTGYYLRSGRVRDVFDITDAELQAMLPTHVSWEVVNADD